MHVVIITLTLKVSRRSRKIQGTAPRTNHRLGAVAIQADMNKLQYLSLVEENIEVACKIKVFVGKRIKIMKYISNKQPLLFGTQERGGNQLHHLAPHIRQKNQ